MHAGVSLFRHQPRRTDARLGLVPIALARLRHRPLVSALGAGAIALGVALTLALCGIRSLALTLVASSPRGFDLIVGARGSGVDLTLCTLYQCARSPGTIPWELADGLATSAAWRPLVWDAVPLAVGDSIGGCPIIGTTPAFFAHPEAAAVPRTACWDPLSPPTLARGTWFRPDSVDAVLGADVPARTGLDLGSTFQPLHGTGAETDPTQVHDRRFRVCGVLARTGTSVDRSVFITLAGFWSIDEHQEGLIDQAEERARQAGSPAPDAAAVGPARVDAAGIVHLQLPPSVRRVSAVLVRSRGPYAAQLLTYRLAAGNEAAAVAPAAVLTGLLTQLLAPVLGLAEVLVALLVGVAAVLVAITTWQAVLAQAGEIALLRALGATRTWILGLVLGECALLGATGAVVGLLPAHLLVGAAATWLAGTTGAHLAWWEPGWVDAGVAAGALALAVLAGLAPAWRACRVGVAEHLS